MKEAEVHIYILPLMTAVEVITYVEIDHTTMETSPTFSEQKQPACSYQYFFNLGPVQTSCFCRAELNCSLVRL